jgi:ABC-2 type transport system permease protein
MSIFTTLIKYWKIWARLTALQFESQISNSRGAATIFIVGKVFRFAFAFIFITAILGRAQNMTGYTLSEAIFILALFVWGSTATQLFFRGVYMFRQKVQDGSFDFYLLTPLNPLFLSLFSTTDPMDVLLMIPYTYILGVSWIASGHPITIAAVLLVIFCMITMFAFAFAIHTVIVAIGVRYLEVDNLIMFFRDIEKMGTYPIDIYDRYVGGVLTYVIPIAIIATVPAKIVFGELSPWYLLVFAALAAVEVRLALWLWNRALTSYTSASS